MPGVWRNFTNNRLWWGLCAVVLLLMLTVPVTFGFIPTFRLNRYETRQMPGSTHVVLKMTNTPEQVLTQLPDKRLRLVLRNCEAGFLTRLRSYSDPLIDKVQVGRRGEDLVLTFTLRNPADGYRLHSEPESGIITLDVGPAIKLQLAHNKPAGRQDIWAGAERLIREFDPPLKSDIPFTPVNRTPVFDLLNPEEAKLFQAGEGALYKGRASEAEELFAAFQPSDPRVKALAMSRLGEARYMLQKYAEARLAFQEAERLAPSFSMLNPSAYFAYGDCIARSGDLAASRRILGRLIAENAEKTYAQVLLVRLGDVLLRNGRDQEARAIYQTVQTHFPTSKAASQARMKLADRQIFATDSDSYLKLLAEYTDLRANAGDFQQREEAAFKAALLQAMYGPVADALAQVTDFEKRYPRSTYVQIMRSMHEDLLALHVRNLVAARNSKELLAVVTSHRDSLAGCLRMPEFIPALIAASAEIGGYRSELDLFRYLYVRGMSADQGAELLLQMVEDARRIEDPQTAEWAARTFIEASPKHGRVGAARERLAELLYRRSDHAGVVAQLSWLLSKDARVQSPLSYYYLGKSLQSQNSLPGAQKALLRYSQLASEKSGASPLLADTYYSLGNVQARLGDRAGALVAINKGLSLAAPERKDQFRYKLGEINAQAGREQTARQVWEQLVKEGKDPEWQALAAESLANLEVTGQMQRVRNAMSKK